MTKNILTIAGSDTLAGGGLQSDLKTFEHYQLFGLSAVTCIAVMRGANFFVHDVPMDVLTEQLNTIKANCDINGVKIGLIYRPPAIFTIREFLEKCTGPIVVDPVLAFKETDDVYNNGYKTILVNELFPLADIVTPNLVEAELISGCKISDLPSMKKAAELIYALGPKSVVIKGGNRFDGPDASDLFYDGKTFELLSKPKLDLPTINGAGCTFSSAIASNLVLGKDLLTAVKDSKEFVYQGIQNGVVLKNGDGNVWH